MAPFPPDNVALQSAPDWSMFRDGPIVLYRRRDLLEADVAELAGVGYVIRRFDCAGWRGEPDMHHDLYEQLGFPDYYGKNWAALRDCLSEIEIPWDRGMGSSSTSSSSGEELAQELTSSWTSSRTPRARGCCSGTDYS
jgi:RNAse (barnase) inhibitor barstar